MKNVGNWLWFCIGVTTTMTLIALGILFSGLADPWPPRILAMAGAATTACLLFAARPEKTPVAWDYRQDLQCWFNLSYASWLALPRVLMEAMPEEWQAKMAELLFEYGETFVNVPDDMSTVVSIKRNGKFIRPPRWLNYRHPERWIIESFKAK